MKRSVVFSKPRLKAPKNLSNRLFCSPGGFSSNAARAGLSVSALIEEIATEFEGVARVGKVDVDENKSLAKRYSIASIPTILLFRNGEIVDRIQGVVPKSVLVSRLHAQATVENSAVVI